MYVLGDCKKNSLGLYSRCSCDHCIKITYNGQTLTSTFLQPNVYVRDAGFQQPTVSSKLRESQLPQKVASMPWIPTSPHSPIKQRSVINTSA